MCEWKHVTPSARRLYFALDTVHDGVYQFEGLARVCARELARDTVYARAHHGVETPRSAHPLVESVLHCISPCVLAAETTWPATEAAVAPP
jgi:hypothetical protein